MPNPSKIKGSNFERKIVKILRDKNYDVRRVPCSGSVSGFKSDIHWDFLGETRKIECKKRKSGFKQIYQWLENNYMLIIEQDRHEPIVILRLGDF